MNASRLPAVAIFTAAVLSLSMLTGCPAIQGLEPEATGLLTEARAQYDRSEYAAAEANCTRYIQRYGDSPVIAEAHYLRGVSRMYLRKPAEAESDLAAALAASGTDLELQAKCRLAMAHVAYERADYRKAAALYARLLEEVEPALQPEILFRLGMALNSIGRKDDGVTTFRRLLAEFPDSPAADRLKKRVTQSDPAPPVGPPGRFAVQIGAFGKSANAQQALTALAARGFAAFIQKRPKAGRELHAVLVGWYATQAEAEAVRRQLLSVYPETILVKRQ